MIVVEEGTLIAGRYRLVRKLARGGMGSVWLARHVQLESEVAIKLIAPELASSPDARARFEREAKCAAQLRSPNVVQVYDYGVEDDTPYIAMELLDGEDLDARLLRERRIAKAAVLVIVSQLCKALHVAHEAGLVHRDLKPANLFLARHGQDEMLKVLDFGIAKVIGLGLSGHTTKTGSLLGSPYYMSPEQVRRSKEVDRRSDLWSLGVIIFQCLTGRLPFQAGDLGELILEICSESLPLASQIAPDLGSEIDGFLSRALSREPSERFQSAPELAEAFAVAVSGLGAAASPEAHAPPLREPEAPSKQGLPGSPAASGTLSPSGNTLVTPPTRSRWRGVLLAVAAAALLLGLLAYTALRSPAPRATTTPQLEPDTPPLAATVTAAAPLPEAASASVQAPASAAAQAPASAAVQAPASAAAQAPASAAPRVRLPPPRKPPPVPAKPPPTKGLPIPHGHATDRP